MQKKYLRIILAVIGILVVVSVAVSVPLYVIRRTTLKHETDRWAVIRDINNDRLAVETTDDNVWAQLVQMKENGSRLWVGGKVKEYENKWSFRFDPTTLTVAQFTAEGLQSTIEGISNDLDYWLSLEYAYVGSIVIEIHLP
ncbi:MAG: hypothetical protein GF308_19350 [Candidatus Heimdallarchaeota archaeon]|nr:hypothetical protein [Candidatus Heimdallarchaeota archaeon]